MSRARELADGALYKITTGASGNLLTSDGSNWASATPPTHLPVTGGSAGTIPYQTAVNQTAHTAVGTAGQVLQSNATSAPTWVDKSAIATPTGVASVMKFT